MAATRAELEAYLQRDWHRARVEKDRAILALNLAQGWAHSLRVVEHLNALARDNGYVETAEERRKDLEAHIALKAKLDAIARSTGAAPPGPRARAAARTTEVVRVRSASARRARPAPRDAGSRPHR